MNEGSGERTIHVLQVDDEPRFSELVEAYLERLDEPFEVSSETDPRKAVETIADEPVDCVVSDYEMLPMDGIAFLEVIREEYPNLPFVLFTGKGSEEVASEVTQFTATEYLQKGGSDAYKLLANRVQNLVDRHRSERRAKIARDRLIQLYEQTDGFYTLDEDWTITYWNQQISDRTGHSPEEVIGQEFWDVFPQAAETCVYDRFREARETGERVEFEVEFEQRGYWAEIRIHPVDSLLFVHSRDITDKREQQQELQYRNELLESFASTVSHDLRNPLSIAEGNLQLAQETGDFQHLEQVAQAHNRMRNLIDELLHVARGDELDRSEVSLADIADRAWETVSSEETDLVVGDDATFEAYESQLRRLFENLFWNAIDHGEAATVRVGTMADGFYVEDDGVGIPPDHREAVFESGFSTAEEGPGYGLSIVRGIVDMHDWEIVVTDADGGGARFEVTGVDTAR
ncbi:response regulator [Halobaculum sp. CBA1158]|uniref:response regulator n=1 Tax=Halobaculum sp. CBA1158 TaxID=2904243 RepID=UPI001F1AC2DB|nr:response regulator [Halobaculum sp. CBA1158]UIO99563.1 response regulator [Halobaculum sp. CBA1158]